MKKEKTLRQKLPPVFCIAIGIPIVFFACLSQYRLQKSMEDSLTRQIENNLDKANQCLDMELDKYDALLYDFCTDEEMLGLLKDINDNRGESDVNSNEILQELSHICNRNSGIVGITIITSSDKIIYYDRLSASSVNSVWASEISAPRVDEGSVYRGEVEPIIIGTEYTYTFQIATKLTDYRDIRKDIGTVVMSIDEDILNTAMQSGKLSRNYLCQDGIIVSAPDDNLIGKNIEDIKTTDYHYSFVKNKASGLTIWNQQSTVPYSQTVKEQAVFWILIAAAAATAMVALSYMLTRPYLNEIDTMAKAMSEVENGNFQVRIPVNDKMTTEIRKISSGFNEMIDHIERLIDQVKTAVVDQKNAELSALEAQIDPHFLYNTLDTINWKAIDKGEFEISEMVGALADILRYSVINAGDTTSIDQETYWLEQYILLQSAKVGKEFKVEIDVPDELKGCRIHKLLIQPFVENAIRHGIKAKKSAGRLTVAMKRAGDQVHISISDDGPGIPEEILDRLNAENESAEAGNANIHMGVKNVRRRLKLYYGDKAGIYYESKEGEYTKVHLFIPVVPSKEGGTDS